jgi:hypothetical protein
MPIKTFRGLMTSGSIDTIHLSTNTGMTGYRILKFELFPNRPGSQDAEDMMKVYKVPQTSADNVADFSDQTLIAAAFFTSGASIAYNDSYTVVFDQEKVNQDLYITYVDTNSADKSANYYLELEQMPLTLDEQTVATLKDIRNQA